MSGWVGGWRRGSGGGTRPERCSGLLVGLAGLLHEVRLVLVDLRARLLGGGRVLSSILGHKLQPLVGPSCRG